jgi:hypothetical protein
MLILTVIRNGDFSIPNKLEKPKEHSDQNAARGSARLADAQAGLCIALSQRCIKPLDFDSAWRASAISNTRRLGVKE